ncbi:MAG: nucleotide sugar dehydrogenase [Tannerella sp.]|jgi:UDP-N-acetyl-D-galactosamine dehydrogenase|nr:nucleotide sugar dehydrogenase [Tannerella sp.]
MNENDTNLRKFTIKGNMKIAVIGLGYVGLPLAIEFGKKYAVVGYDTNLARVAGLIAGYDSTREADLEEMNRVVALRNTSSGKGMALTADENDLKGCNVYIVTVPTPVDSNNSPDLKHLIYASETVGRVISKGNIVIYESTTYPGCTEEDCIPVVERISGLKYNVDFYAGYSPERINPGDKVNTLTRIRKVTSGSTPEIADQIDSLYASIIEAGTHKAPSIQVAEASKIIENAQRDVNISFINELALIFDRMGIDTNDVLEAAGTKWNFLRYYPGLVGGHCISVDPYYLAHKAESLGYVPQVILSGRHVNNSIAPFIAHKVMKLMIQKGHQIKGAHVLILGITFKENCPDIRNTKIADVYQAFCECGIQVDVYDPLADPDEVSEELGIALIKEPDSEKRYAAIVLAVAHHPFMSFDFESHHKANTVIFDVKAVLDRKWVDGRL